MPKRIICGAKNTMKRIIAILIILVMVIASGCGGDRQPAAEDQTPQYSRISQEEAVKMMGEETGYLIVDVRRPDEYAEGHIPDAINVPNEEIADEMPEALPDKDQMLFLYCRTGRRSKEAASKLAGMGYTNVYEFGGINDWKGKVVTEEQENLVKVTYDMKMKIGDTEVSVDWEKNDAVDTLAKLTAGEWYEIDMSIYGGFEQVGAIGTQLPANDSQTTTEPGDIVLYSGNQIVVFYGSNSWAYTRLGHITDRSADELTELLGNGDVTISLRTEYSE